METMSYDIIGDIHGQFNKLCDLLRQMGYSEADGVFSHPTRKAIFVGDFIDRGPQQKAVLDLVMDMVRHGKALAVMGNHEFNALAFHTEHPSRPGAWLRPRSDKNILQHIAFLQEYLDKDSPNELVQVLDFFRSLPLWLELPGVRVIHACWDPTHMAAIRPSLDKQNRLTKEALVKSSQRGTAEYDAIETLLKGPEVALPEGVVFVDKYGTRRKKMRLRWWRDAADHLAEQVVDRGNAVKHLQVVDPVEVNGYPDDAPPLFFGHYWFKGEPSLVRKNLACLDYSAASVGPLVAYRWQGEQTLNEKNFCSSDQTESSSKGPESENLHPNSQAS